MKKIEQEIKQSIKQKSKERRYKRDEEGRKIIYMTVEDDSNFLSRFSAGDTPVISPEVAEFIEDATCTVLPKVDLTLRIHSTCIDREEQEIYRKAIKEHYIGQYISVKRELTKNKLLSVVMAVFGIIILAISLLLDGVPDNTIWSETVNIVAWVFIWEAVHIAAFQNKDLRVKKHRFLSYLAMKIEFDNRLNTKSNS